MKRFEDVESVGDCGSIKGHKEGYSTKTRVFLTTNGYSISDIRRLKLTRGDAKFWHEVSA